MRSHYDVLGVDPHASRAEIRQAYRRAVRQLHPDHRPVGVADGDQATAQLVAVVDAWRVLGDPDRRALYDEVWQAAARRAQLVSAGRTIETGSGRNGVGVGEASDPVPTVGAAGPAAARWGGPWPPAPGPGPANPPGRVGWSAPLDYCHQTTTARPRPASAARQRPRRADECRLCGSAPAVPVDLRGQRSGVLRGLLVGGVSAERGPLCRSCGLAVLRQLTDAALCGGQATGRYGDATGRRSVLSAVLSLAWLWNLLTVVGNLSFWLRLRRLAVPVRDPWVRSPLGRPLDPGPPLWRRPGGLVGLLGIGLVVAVVVAWHLVMGLHLAAVVPGA